MEKRFSNVAGFDDAPFDRNAQGDVTIVGTVYAGLRFDGVLMTDVEKDGFNAASRIIESIEKSRFPEHIRLIMLGGIAFAGFNVIDVFELYERLCTPVLVIARRAPDMDAICRALTGGHIPHGRAKWELIRRLGPMTPVKNVFAQTIGLSAEQAADTIERFSIHGNMPEPLRSSHLIAGALSYGHSRGRP
ncbi:MAG: DUF99 family protein [Desulfosalsimonadaceae bacterium]